MISTNHYLVVALMLFFTGASGMLIRRNLLTLFMCLELMLNGVNLAIVAFGQMHNNLDGQVFVFFLVVIAACEAAVGLALVIAAFRHYQSINSVEYTNLKG